MNRAAGDKAAIEQEMADRLAQFRALRARGALCTEATEQFAAEAASSFLSHYRKHGEILRDAITLLAEIATLEEPCLSQPGQQATFPMLVETLSDSFDPRDCSLYDRAFAQMIHFCRQLPAAADLDAGLQRFGIETEQDLLVRKARLREQKPLLKAEAQRNVRKVLVLSRVTLGADVAITNVILGKMRQTFPQAERVLLGSPKLHELFGGDGSLRIREVRYETDGTLLDRLRNWLPLVETVEEETRGLRPEEYLLVDPDSRLLQLGLLPVLRDETRYFFLESRRFGEPGQGALSQITLRWLQETFSGQDQIFPSVHLRETDREVAQEFCGRLRDNGSEFLVAVSFGVGGNPKKRFSDSFEERLVSHLLQEGSTVLLDKGFGGEEIERASRLVEKVKAGGYKVVELQPPTFSDKDRLPLPGSCQMVVWEGGIGAWSALVGASDEYVGYDSAGQHIAAALGVPTLDIFTETASPIFRERWRPAGKGIVKVAEQALSGRAQEDSFLSEVLVLHEEIKAQRPGPRK
ncbi:MAG: hypothetical protein A3G20_01900 [Acidobacteria bacterium RIFCSPLOWO2_12_FULL_59_11]|nr:MAG: hypothetical protein A3G20_01900 [Acidobacteria bacterium RIFCSPLOWO2_12_FULL_59_11]